MMPLQKSLSIITVGLALSGCGGKANDETADDAGCGPEFVASQGDFANYQSWTSLDGGTASIDNLPVGQRTIYLNQTPPAGSTAFPSGTIIVKTDEADGGQTFAMAKRCGGFNTGGANGWEWFGLAATNTGATQIIWRGAAPPASQGYGPSFGSCNSCHQSASSNDYVDGTALLLSSF